MKKLIVILVLVVAFQGLKAQFSNEIPFSGGPRVGLNISSFTGDIDEPGIKAGAHIGGIGSFDLTENLALQPSILFSMKGGNKTFEMETPIDTLTIENQVGLNYVELPVNLTYSIEVGPGDLQIFAGGYFAYGLSGTNTRIQDGDENEYDIEFVSDATDADTSFAAFSPMDYGARGGLGYKMNDIQVQASFAYGLANLKPKQDGDAPDGTQNNAVFQLSVAYLFGSDETMRYY